jgi:NADH-quinone oxidoreductase subunit G
MPEMVKLTVDGRQIEAPKGQLLIDACKREGIEIPAFCYHEGLSLQAACRMCLVEVEKMPKLQTACTLPVSEGMVVKTDHEKISTARKTTLEFLLTNHPLDCPVCDKGGECELQDMVFRYGAGESRFTEFKVHQPEKQWSPVVYFDPGRCILCYRCVRICNEGMGVGALGVTNRGVNSEITPNMGDHLNCDECGMCIDICPVGALTSGTYRYKTRPWEMEHVGTVCTHCSNGCKTTLGVRNGQIVRGNNRDKSGINGEFLCIKGRYGFDFVHNEERLTSPMVRKNGQLEPVSWAEALKTVAAKFKSLQGGEAKKAVIGSNRITNEEAFYLQKFARKALHTNHVDHFRSGDFSTLLDAVSGQLSSMATVGDLYTSKAVVVIGSDLSQQHPLLAFRIRENFRHHQAKVYTITRGPVREAKVAAKSIIAKAGEELAVLEQLRESLNGVESLSIVFGDAIKGDAVRKLVAFADSLGAGSVKYVCLVDYANSRGAMDMGLMPDLLPGYHAVSEAGLHKGMNVNEILSAPQLDLLWVVGEDPLAEHSLSSKPFLVVQDMFMTETAQAADVVLPSASNYEKTGTMTNVTGEVQRLKVGPKVMGPKSDLEIMGLLSKELGVDLGVWRTDAVFDEIRKTVRGYNVALPVIVTGGAAQTMPVNGRVPAESQPELIRSAEDTLFTSGSLTKYSKKLNSVMEAGRGLYQG